MYVPLWLCVILCVACFALGAGAIPRPKFMRGWFKGSGE